MDRSFSVSIRVENRVDKHVGEPLFVAGNFNDWQPAAWQIGAVPAVGDIVTVQLNGLKAEFCEFKLTRGTWDTLACSKMGCLGESHEFRIGEESEFGVAIEGWRDDFPLSTASPQVRLLDEAFFLPTLNVHKRIWIYLPEGYSFSNDRYPVIYMHDGQHLFDEATALGRKGPVEWRVDKTIDHSVHDAIVVAIEHAHSREERIKEYFFSPSERFPQPRGRAYLEDILTTLKPYIDSHFRTLPDRRHTAMVGSSMGGLLTLYAGIYYPDVFGTLGVFSPSIWLDERRIFDAMVNRSPHASFQEQYYYLYGGGRENRAKPGGGKVDMAKDVMDAIQVMENTIRPRTHMKLNPTGKHGALYWQGAFADFFEWWMGKLKVKSKK
ncbi:alpha/beta hydrolase [Olivibacter sitiensis]|uniref:alpha/beta hydrolase n=1 Tax=Olivibacter sitiensis TaxID=376470 RepID=UPI000406BC49|nr:alpha/beta hydrolase-fold protein [Olivibacter sitiensis]